MASRFTQNQRIPFKRLYLIWIFTPNKRMKKLLFTLTGIIAINLSVQSQDLVLNGHLSAGGTIVTVIDDDKHPSNGLDGNGELRDPADGHTVKEKDGTAIGLGFTADYYITKGFGVFSGIWFAYKDFSIRNRDGSYSGASTYAVNYFQLPIGATYLSPELAPKLKVYGRLGLTVDIKAGEQLKGADGAHYWNLATNNTSNDPTRGRNGNGKDMALFAPLGLGLHMNAGVEYALEPNLRPFLGIGINQSMTNAFNPNLKHNDPNKTSVTEDLFIGLTMVTLDLGIRF
jgi:hypothetical protein